MLDTRRHPSGGTILTVVGADERGLIYGALELADVAEHSGDTVEALSTVAPGVHRAATPVRSILRTLTSEVQDLAWFRDPEFWDEYLTHLATHRINRLQLALGMQYNYSHDPDVRDNYLAFAYPFLLDLAGFDVEVEGLDPAERRRNLEALQHISTEAARRGIHFQLGLWNHAYDFLDSPRQRYRITGVDESNHAEYCRAALRELLTQCPDINGITIRVHYEGGIHEPTHEFWGTVFQAVEEIERPVEIDMHSKGADARILDAARATKSPFVVSAKYWAEHQGLPYHQAAVRDMEAALPPRDGLSGVTRAVRRFTRYGFGDFLRQDRDHGFLFRLWPGTQRVLLWGDPEQVAGMARATAAVGGLGVELCEPLTFLGRKTTGTYGGRQIYDDPDLKTAGDPWSKYAYTYRVWGRLLYDPDADPATWRRYLRAEYGRAGDEIETALGAASRILPLVTTFHGPSASNNFYWPEMYVNMPLAHHGAADIYAFDTPEPHTVGAVSPFDSQLFLTIDGYVDEVLSGRSSGRYSPADAAGWLEDLTATAQSGLSSAAVALAEQTPSFRRAALDIAALAQLGRFFSAKTRAGISYEFYVRTSLSSHLSEAVEHYRRARDAFRQVVDLTSGAYVSDLAFGDRRSERGHWTDRLEAVEQDLADLEAERAAVLGCVSEQSVSEQSVSDSRVSGLGTRSPRPQLSHDVPTTFEPGAGVPVTLTLHERDECTVELHYRHLNHAEQWQSSTMEGEGPQRRIEIPGPYTDTPYPLHLYFTVQAPNGEAWVVPGFESSLTNMPYLVIHQAAEGR